MLNLLVKAQEAITTFVINRFQSFDHNINGSHRLWIDAKNYASLSAAIDACGAGGSKPCTLAITNNQALSSNKTVLPHVVLWRLNSGKITFSGGAILTIQGGLISNGLQQFFFGTGTVVLDTGFIDKTYPQLWGAKGDGVTEDTTAIQAAITAVSTNNITVKLVAGNYLFDDLDLPNKCNLQGEGSALTKLTRKSGAAGVGLESSGGADDIVLEGFELDCDFEGTDGIKLGFSGGAWGESGSIKDVKITDCAGINAHLNTDRANIKQLSIFNTDGGGVGTHQLKLEGDVINIYDLRLTGETGTTANIEFAGDNANIFGMFLDDPHLTKAIRLNGDNNSITGLKIVTEDNTKTYTQLLYFETNAIENLVRDVHIEKGATDTITNSVQDDENNDTLAFVTNFEAYNQIRNQEFSVFDASAQSIPDNTDTKIEFNSEVVNVKDVFDVSVNFRYTPLVKGMYLLTANVNFQSGSVDQVAYQAKIYKNGASHKENLIETSGTDSQSVGITAIVEANGTTDFFEIFVLQNTSGALSTLSGSEKTYFMGSKIA